MCKDWIACLKLNSLCFLSFDIVQRPSGLDNPANRALVVLPRVDLPSTSLTPTILHNVTHIPNVPANPALAAVIAPVMLLVSDHAALEALAAVPRMCLWPVLAATCTPFAVLTPVVVLITCLSARLARAVVPLVTTEHASQVHCYPSSLRTCRSTSPVEPSGTGVVLQHMVSRPS